MLILSNGLKNAMLAAMPPLFAGGAIMIYTGAQPASPHLAPTGTLLGYVTDGGGAYTVGSATNGLHIALSTGGFWIPEPTEDWAIRGVATGVAGWARFIGLDDTLGVSSALARIDMKVNDDGTGFLLNNTTITNGEVRPLDYALYGIPPFA